MYKWRGFICIYLNDVSASEYGCGFRFGCFSMCNLHGCVKLFENSCSQKCLWGT